MRPSVVCSGVAGIAGRSATAVIGVGTGVQRYISAEGNSHYRGEEEIWIERD